MVITVYVSVYRQGEIGSSWYAVLGGSLEARVSHTAQTSTTNSEKVSMQNNKSFFYSFIKIESLINILKL